MTASQRAFAVVDLGFGDAGKGLLTDYLVRRSGASVVVRFNGGAQAGHNVVTPDGRHHTFAQVGAGTFVPGVRTFLARQVLVHPTALLREAAALQRVGVDDALARLAVSEQAVIITPFHQAANRLRELARGKERHGSCGVGVGEAAADALRAPGEALRAGSLRERDTLRVKLARVRERLHAQLPDRALDGEEARRERALFEDDDVLDRWIAEATGIAPCVVADATLTRWLCDAPAVVFEGAQGVLLDETHGFHPFTTWSTCTPRDARLLLGEAAPGVELEVVGVLRAHAVRHGPGPLPTESALVRPHRDDNASNRWQGQVRYGWLDVALARYALAVCGPVHALALTHVDLLPSRPRWPVGVGYDRTPADLELLDPSGHLRLPAVPSLEQQARRTQLLLRAHPRLVPLPGGLEGFLRNLEPLLGRRVELTVEGPTAAHVRERPAP